MPYWYQSRSSNQILWFRIAHETHLFTVFSLFTMFLQGISERENRSFGEGMGWNSFLEEINQGEGWKFPAGIKKKGLCILMMKFLFLILFIILEKRTFRAIVALPAGIVTAGYMEEINKDESL